MDDTTQDFDRMMWEGSAHELAAHPVTPQWRYLATQGRVVEVYEPRNIEPEGDTDATS